MSDNFRWATLAEPVACHNTTAVAIQRTDGPIRKIDKNKDADKLVASAATLRSVDELQVVHRAALRLQHVLKPEELAAEIIRVLEDTLGYEHAAVLLADEFSERLLPFALSDQGQGASFVERDREYILSSDVRVDRGITGWVAKHGATVRLGDAQTDPRYVGLRKDIASELCVPMWSHGRVIGVVNVETSSRDAYTESDQRLLEIIAAHFAVAIQNSRLQQSLMHHGRMDAIGRLTSGIAHDFNNMLAVINGHTELLLLRNDLDKPLRDALGQINEAGSRAAQMTQHLLASGRKSVLQPQIIDPRQAVSNLRSMFENVLGANIALVIESAADCGRIEVDPAQFDQVMINIAINARDAMPDGGTFRVALSTAWVPESPLVPTAGIKPGRHVLITLTDTGTGMDEVTRRSLFEPFFTTKSHGSGLGLAMAQGVISQSGGTILVDSTPGAGTAFRIYLPTTASAPSHVSDAELGAAPPELDGAVLVVEDNEAVRLFIVSLVRSLGYSAISAASGAEALEVAAEPGLRIALILSDVVMPGMGVRELLREMRSLHPRARALLMSGYPKHGADMNAQEVLSDNVLAKPFTRAALKRKIIEIFAIPPGVN